MTSLITEITVFLTELSQSMAELLKLLELKGELLTKNTKTDAAKLTKVQAEEEVAAAVVRKVFANRDTILKTAKKQGFTADTVEILVEQLVKRTGMNEISRKLQELLSTVKHQTRMLQTQNMTNWVISKRSLTHVSQILDLIAFKGKNHSTYRKGRAATSTTAEARGVILDRNG